MHVQEVEMKEEARPRLSWRTCWSCWRPQQRCKSGAEADLFNLKEIWGQNNIAGRMEFLELAP